MSALWLVGLGGAHLALGLCTHRRWAIARPIRQTSIAIGVVLVDVAFGLSASGLMLVAGWGAAGVAFAWLVRRSDSDTTDAVLATLGVGVHIGLVLVRTIIEAPPSGLTSGSTELVQLMTVAILAASCFASAQLAGGGRGLLRAGPSGWEPRALAPARGIRCNASVSRVDRNRDGISTDRRDDA